MTPTRWGPGGARHRVRRRRRDYAMWKRYRGGTAGRLWIDRQDAGVYVRLLPELDGQLTAPMCGRAGGVAV
ncbi:MAG: hypothetical protein M3332_05345 [Actinomycetota bacterium]|nr:hypothetical protein [Actinomycetota bacterium]